MIHRRSGLQQQPCRRPAAQLPTAKQGRLYSHGFTDHRGATTRRHFDVTDGSREHSSVNRCCSSWPSESVLQAFVVSETPVAPSPCKQKTRCEEKVWNAALDTVQPRPRSLSWRQMLWQQQNVWGEMCPVKQQIRQTFPPSCVSQT